jgi:NTE family protein
VTETVGVVLAGAGARGAFEAGAMAELLPALQEQDRRPRIYSGSSAGAINAVLLGSLAHLPADQAAEELSRQWSHTPTSSMIRSVGLAWPVTGVRYLAGRAHLPVPPVSLLDPPSLRALLGRWNGWDDLHRNIADGVLDAVALPVTDLTTNRTVVHVETQPDRALPADDDERGIHYVRTRLGLEHVYASSCIPFVSPPVEFPDERGVPTWNVDGGVRLNVPLKPVLDLGADRLVVVATDVDQRLQTAPVAGAPTLIDLSDQLLHLATGDRLLEDLRTLTQINTLIAAGAGGANRQGRTLQKVPVLLATPESATDLSDLVLEALSAGPGRFLVPLGRFVSRLTGVPGDSGPDLATFLLFLSAFTRRAVDLGRERAAKVLTGPDDGWHSD